MPNRRIARIVLLCALSLLTGRVAVAQTCSPTASGLVAWWPGEGSAAEVTGAHHGSLAGAVTFVPGMVGSAFSLDGNSFVRVPDSPALNPMNAITVEAWINPPVARGGFPPIVKKNGPSDAAGYALELDGSTVGFFVFNVGQVSGVPIPIGQWTHVAATYDRTFIRLYVNGALAASQPASGPMTQSQGELHLGHDPVLNRYFEGYIDDVGIFGVALPAEAIRALHAAGAAGKCAVFDPSAPPLLILPADMTTSGGPTGRLVFFDASAWDSLDGPLAATCSPVSGSLFPLGSTTVSCTAANSRGLSATGSFTATVVEVTTNEVGLLGHWKFDELGGTAAFDSSGNGRDGAISGATYTSTDGASIPTNASALRFDGADAVVVPYSPAFNVSAGDPVTFSFWIRPAAHYAGEFACIVNKIWPSGASSDYAVCIYMGGVFVLWWNGSWLENTSVSTRSLEPGRLTHVAVVYDGAGTMRFYTDGQLDAAGGDHARGAFQDAVATSGSNVLIGGPHGMLDDVRIYNRALSPVEVSSLNSARGLEVDEVFAPYAGTATLKAVLFADGVLVPGKTVTFTLGGTTVGTAITDDNGVATLDVANVSGFDVGEHPIAIGATVSADAQIAADSAAAMLTIVPAAPVITWTLPTLDVGAILDLALLAAATGSVAGTFEYADSSLIGTTLTLGQELCATFTPSDLARYERVTICVFVAERFGDAPVEIARITGGTFVGGSAPSNPAVDSLRNLLYVPNAENGTVIVADGTTGETIRAISLSSDTVVGVAGAMTLDEARNRLYVADAHRPEIWVVDPTLENPVVQTITLPGVAFWLEFNPSTGLLYALSGPAGVVVIDPVIPSDIVSIAVCSPSSLTVNPTTNLVYVLSNWCDNAQIIDGDPQRVATFNTVIGELSSSSGTFAEPGGVIVDRRTNRVYFLSRDLHRTSVQAFDGNPQSPTFHQLLSVIPLPLDGSFFPTGIGVDTNRGHVYARGWAWDASGRSTLTVIDAKTAAVTSAVMLPFDDQFDSFGHVGVNSNTGRIYVTSRNNVTGVFEHVRGTTLPTATSAAPVTVASSQVSVTFSAVTGPGETTIQQLDPETIGPLPGGFQIDGGQAFEISTTASVSSPIQLCFDASWVTDAATFSTLAVLHGENGVWVDRTVSRNFATTTICASVTSLSPFVIARYIEPTYGVVRLYDSARSFKAGSTAAIRLQITDSDGVNLSSASLAVHVIELRQTSSSASASVVDAGQSNADMDFRHDPDLGGTGGYIFNLKTTGLATGSYELRFTVGSGRQRYAVPLQIR